MAFSHIGTEAKRRPLRLRPNMKKGAEDEVDLSLGGHSGTIFRDTAVFHCVPLAIETIKILFIVSQLDLIALK